MKQKKYIWGLICLFTIFMLLAGCQKKQETSSGITIRKHKVNGDWRGEYVGTEINANQSFFIASKNGLQSVIS